MSLGLVWAALLVCCALWDGSAMFCVTTVCYHRWMAGQVQRNLRLSLELDARVELARGSTPRNVWLCRAVTAFLDGGPSGGLFEPSGGNTSAAVTTGNTQPSVLPLPPVTTPAVALAAPVARPVSVRAPRGCRLVGVPRHLLPEPVVLEPIPGQLELAS